MVFVEAKVGPSNCGDPKEKFTVQYFDKEGNMTIRSGGTRTWRCNNPGALLKSPYSMGKDRHAIGSAGDGKYSYAVYPDYKTGHEALIVMLGGSVYSHLTLREASSRYVKEDPDHICKIIKLSGNRLNPDQKIQSLKPEEFEIYWKAIEANENWAVGQEDFIERWFIAGVHKKRGVIFEYYIKTAEGNGWIAKSEAIKLAKENKLHAILVHMKSGSLYLRSENGTKPFVLIT